MNHKFKFIQNVNDDVANDLFGYVDDSNMETVYYIPTVCVNGHIISESESNYQPKCGKCGEDTISICQNCNMPIKGWSKPKGISGHYPMRLEYFCYSCGLPYPWTQKIIDNAVELATLDDLSPDQIEVIKASIPNLIVTSIDTPLSSAKFKKILDISSSAVNSAMYQLLVDVLSESAKKILFPSD